MLLAVHGSIHVNFLSESHIIVGVSAVRGVMTISLKKRLFIYLIGLLVMALGIVLIKKAELGMSPISSIPAAVAGLTSFTLGNMVIAFQLICILLQVIILRRFTLKLILQLPLSVAFGYLIDLYVFLIRLGQMPIWLRCALCLAGVFCTALGIVLIVGMDMVLPAPDALLRTISQQLQKPLGPVKIIGDLTWVVITIVIELIGTHSILSVGIGTVLSVLLTGKFVTILKKRLPQWESAPAGTGKQPEQAADSRHTVQ